MKAFAFSVLSLLTACPAAAPESVAVTNAVLGSVNVRDYNASGDGLKDDRAAIQAAIDTGAGEIVFPAGVYIIGRGNGYFGLSIPAGVTLRGESRDGTVLQQAAGVGGSVRLLQVAAPNITIRDLTLDGDKAEQTVDEHRSGVFATGAPGLTIRGVTARNFTGDGFFLYQGSNNATIDDVLATDNDRNGITFGGGTTGGTVTASKFLGNRAQQLDSEPGNGATVDGIVLRGNTFDGAGKSADYAVTVSGSSPAARSRGWTIENNTIHGGIFVVWADAITIRDNTGTNPTTKPSATVYRTADGVAIEGNRFTMTQASAAGVGVVAVVGTGTGSAPAHVRIARNQLTATGYARSIGVRVEGASSVEITDNDIRGPGLAAAEYAGIFLRATIASEDFRSAIVRRNAISNWGAYGVLVAGNGSARMLSLDIVDNVFDDSAGTMTGAMSLDDGTGAAKAIAISGNVVTGGVATSVVRYPGTTAILVAGQRGMGASYNVAAAPEGLLAESPGAIATSRADGTMWRKAAGIGATGWIAL